MTKRPSRRFKLPEGDDYAALVSAVTAERERPIAKACGKLFDFVNAAVQDPDFRHADSATLLSFLLLVRDELADGINELWDMDDVFAPLVKVLHQHRSGLTKGKPRPNRKSPLRRGLEMLVDEGLDNDAVLDVLGDADEVSRRVASDGFPFFVHDPETTLRDDGELTFYLPGSSSDETLTVTELRKRLSLIRRSH